MEVVSDPSIVISPAVKGRAIVIEDREVYLVKMERENASG